MSSQILASLFKQARVISKKANSTITRYTEKSPKASSNMVMVYYQILSTKLATYLTSSVSFCYQLMKSVVRDSYFFPSKQTVSLEVLMLLFARPCQYFRHLLLASLLKPSSRVDPQRITNLASCFSSFFRFSFPNLKFVFHIKHRSLQRD